MIMYIARRQAGFRISGNKMRAAILLLSLIFVQAAPRAHEHEKEGRPCLTVASARVLRIDENSMGIFLQVEPGQISTRQKIKSLLLSVQEKIRACHPGFGNEWAVSFFSDEKYARYKTEIDSESLMNGSWQASYLGEYDRNKQKMTLYPLHPKRVKSFNLVLP